MKTNKTKINYADNQEVMEQVMRILGDTRYQITDMPSAAEIAEAERQMEEVRAKYKGEIVPITEDAFYPGQRMKWTEQFKPGTIQIAVNKKLYHLSDDRIDAFYPKETAFFAHRPDTDGHYYELTVNKTIEARESATEEEIRIELGDWADSVTIRYIGEVSSTVTGHGWVQDIEGKYFRRKRRTTADGTQEAWLPLIEKHDQRILTDQWMKAPNGEPTKLTERQWLLVRTQLFKDWFGDWENDPKNASKVVDENGEPLVVYHGGEVESEFSPTKSRRGFFFFAQDKGAAEYYASSYRSRLVEAFLSSPNILDLMNPYSVENKDFMSEYAEYYDEWVDRASH